MTNPLMAAAIAELTEQVNRDGINDLDATYAPFSPTLTHLVEVTAVYLGPESRTARQLPQPIYVSGPVGGDADPALVTLDVAEALRDARTRLTRLHRDDSGELGALLAAVDVQAITEIGQRLARLEMDA